MERGKRINIYTIQLHVPTKLGGVTFSSSSSVSQLEKAQRSVSIGEDLIRDSIMMNFDVKVSKEFLPLAMKLTLEKCRRMIDVHEAVRNLPGPVYQKIRAQCQLQVCANITLWHQSVLRCVRINRIYENDDAE